MGAFDQLLAYKSNGGEPEGEGEKPEVPLGGTRAQAMQRLQAGIAGILVMVLVVGLAAALTQRAQTTEDLAVPNAAPTTEPEETEPQSDPLADAGVVPDLPDEGEDETQDPALVPELGDQTEVEDTEAP